MLKNFTRIYNLSNWTTEISKQTNKNSMDYDGVWTYNVIYWISSVGSIPFIKRTLAFCQPGNDFQSSKKLMECKQRGTLVNYGASTLYIFLVALRYIWYAYFCKSKKLC